MAKKKKRALLTQAKFEKILDGKAESVREFGARLAKHEHSGNKWVDAASEFLDFFKKFNGPEEEAAALLIFFTLGLKVGSDRAMLEAKEQEDDGDDGLESGNLFGGNKTKGEA